MLSATTTIRSACDIQVETYANLSTATTRAQLPVNTFKATTTTVIAIKATATK